LLLLAACGGRVAEPASAQPVTEPGPPDAGAAALPEAVVITDEAPDQEPEAPAPAEEPAAAPEPAAGAAAPATVIAAEDPLCLRHREELMGPPRSPRPPIDCGRVDRVVYWRWTAAEGCRDVTRLSLRRGGEAVLERSNRQGASAACGEPSVSRTTVDPADAADAIRAACKEFNGQYDPGAGLGCPAGSRLVEFFDGPLKSGRTEALPCGSRSMTGAFERLDRLLQRF
jgi:hypothetical protein